MGVYTIEGYIYRYYVPLALDDSVDMQEITNFQSFLLAPVQYHKGFVLTLSGVRLEVCTFEDINVTSTAGTYRH